MAKEEKDFSESKSEKEVEKEMKEANISLILEDYQDIFSDFDPRPYSEKALSDDFLQECKRAVREQQEGFELRLMIPANKRNFAHESKIKKRLKDHFQKHFKEKQEEIFGIRKQGYIWAALGLLVLLGVLLGLLYLNNNFIITILTMLELPCWFLTWEGLGKILITSKEKKPEYDFYKKMASCQAMFLNY
jgi:hypothetical protein